MILGLGGALPGQHGRDHRPDLRPDLGKHLRCRPTEGAGVLVADQRAPRIVVEEDEVGTPVQAMGAAALSMMDAAVFRTGGQSAIGPSDVTAQSQSRMRPAISPSPRGQRSSGSVRASQQTACTEKTDPYRFFSHSMR